MSKQDTTLRDMAVLLAQVVRELEDIKRMQQDERHLIQHVVMEEEIDRILALEYT